MRNRRFFLLLRMMVPLVFTSPALSEQSSWEGTRLRVESWQHSLSNDERTHWPHNQLHFPFLYEASDGTRYMTYREGPHSAILPGNRVQTVLSSDGGKTWSSPRDLGTERGVSPQLLQLENRALILSYGTRDVYVRASYDGGHTWLAPLLVNKGPGSGYTNLQALGPGRFRLIVDSLPFSGHHARVSNHIIRVVLRATPQCDWSLLSSALAACRRGRTGRGS